jgi:hypothetical protein
VILGESPKRGDISRWVVVVVSQNTPQAVNESVDVSELDIAILMFAPFARLVGVA